MRFRNLLVLAALLLLATCDNILVVLDNAELVNTHSQLLDMLKSSHNVEVRYNFDKEKISLKNYDRFKYQHVIVMSLSTKCKVVGNFRKHKSNKNPGYRIIL